MSITDNIVTERNPYIKRTLRSFKEENGDLVIDSKTKNPEIVTKFENIAQSIKRALLTTKGSNKLYPSIGMDYDNLLQMLRGQDTQTKEELLELMILSTINDSTPYANLVDEIEIIRSNFNERKFNINVYISTETDRLSLNLTILGTT